MSQTAILAAPVDIVGAAESCFARFGVAKTTVEDIAAGAGVSRATVYRHFPGGRDEIILAVLLRSAQAFLPQLPARLGSARSVGDAIVDLVVSAVEWVRSEPWRVRMLASPLSRTAEASDAAAIYAACTEFIAPYFSQARAAGMVRRGVQLPDAVEYVVRMIHSLLVVPGHRDRSVDELRRYVRTYVVGALLVR
ncbi:MAG TPA: TetR/AcrR family transcriptional regulator [Mycobacteriales bacterium]|jgi:AcrR family transcriptional regulator|nr:TetR/AcrR family transcriptional regulator [Mycobacteriales bacterium]